MKNQKKIALIIGQDGSCLAELLIIDKKYEVHGIKRQSNTFKTQRIDHLYQDRHNNYPNLILHYGDLRKAKGEVLILEKGFNLNSPKENLPIFRY